MYTEEIVELDDLDDSWILDFENKDEEYKQFYKENVQSIKVSCMYINKDNYLEKIKEECIFLKNPNVLSKEEIILLLKQNNTYNKIKYSLLNILKYNIDLEPTNLKTFLKTKNNINYLTNVTNIDNVYFIPTIYTFQDLNSIFFLFYDNTNTNTNTNANTNANTNVNDKNITKKIFIKSIHCAKNKTYKKTI